MNAVLEERLGTGVPIAEATGRQGVGNGGDSGKGP
jgi:hypothetical protein